MQEYCCCACVLQVQVEYSTNTATGVFLKNMIMNFQKCFEKIIILHVHLKCWFGEFDQNQELNINQGHQQLQSYENDGEEEYFCPHH